MVMEALVIQLFSGIQECSTSVTQYFHLLREANVALSGAALVGCTFSDDFPR